MKDPVKYNKNGKIQQKEKKRFLKIPLATSQKTSNCLLKSIGTEECKKLIKKEKKVDIEKIFIKSK
jgi:hypothetical protein